MTHGLQEGRLQLITTKLPVLSFSLMSCLAAAISLGCDTDAQPVDVQAVERALQASDLLAEEAERDAAQVPGVANELAAAPKVSLVPQQL